MTSLPPLTPVTPEDESDGFVDLDEIIDDVRRHIPGPLDKDITDAARYAAITFCRSAQVIRSDAVRQQAAEGEYIPLPAPEPLRPFRILQVSADGQPVWQWETDAMRGYLKGITLCSGGHNLLVRYALIPHRTARRLPVQLIDLYGDVLVHGTLSELYILPGKTWSNGELSQYHRARFTDGWRLAYRQSLQDDPVSGDNSPPYFGDAF